MEPKWNRIGTDAHTTSSLSAPAPHALSPLISPIPLTCLDTLPYLSQHWLAFSLSAFIVASPAAQRDTPGE